MPGPDAGVGPSGGPTQARRRVGIVASSTGERDGLLLERDRELERIGGCLHRAQQGDGGALVVEGPAGIGKTVLLAAGRDTAERDGFRVLRARGAELEREFAFGVVRQLVEPVVAGASVEERAGLLQGPPGVAARMLGLPGLEGGAVAAAPLAPDPSFAVLHGLYWLCANLATGRPLALVVDDAHWADAASLRFLAFLLPRLEELHAAVLLGARPAEAGASRELLAALTMDPATEVVTVGPLTPRGVATLVAAGLGVEPEPEFAAACWEATGGTPFLVRTLIEALREERIAPVTASAGDDWTVEQLRAAAREASARGAPESATAYLRRALSEPPSREVGPGLLLELGTAEFSAGQAGWHDHLEAAVESARDDTTRTAAALWFANALRFHQRLAESVEVCDGVAGHLDRRDVDGRLVLEAMAVNCGMIDATTAPQVGDRARRAIAAGPRPLPEPGDPPWFPSAVIALYWAEHFDEARVLLDAAVIEALAAANGMILPAVLAHRAYLALRRGDLTAAEADVRALQDALRRPPPPLYVPLAMGVLVDVLVERGDLDEAERALERSGADLAGTSVTAITLRHARGRLLFARRRFGEALDDLRAVGEIAIGTGAISPCYLPWRSDAALAALALGEADTARRLSDEEVELARAFGAPRALGVALRAAGLVAGGQRAETLLREAIEVLAGPDTRLEEARALADLGALMRRSNRRVEARQLLRPAINTARHLGAGALAQQAETELRATGARPRRVLLSGLEALTASERRIAELAAEGLTNREIAQTLFVTSRTVEGHLTHVFQKLDVKARTALPAALATPPKQSAPKPRPGAAQSRGGAGG